ncbi:MAG: mobile mystery protein A [Actinomycetota bacterium]
MARDSEHARRQLDSRFERLRPIADAPHPQKGWIRAIRDALGMTTSELADRLGLSQSTISDLETSELHDTIRLGSLRRAAGALDCDLVYFLLPHTSLDEAVRRQARRKAAQHLDPVAHHSRLEDQAVTSEEADAQLNELVSQFIDRRGLWTERDSRR